MPICIKCGKEFPGSNDPSQDQSTFICDECQDLINLKAWKSELRELKKKAAKVTPSQEARRSWVDKKIKEVEARME